MTNQPPYGHQGPVSSGPHPSTPPGVVHAPLPNPESGKPSKGGRRFGLAALAIATIALLLGRFAAVQSWRAADKADQALDQLNEFAGAPAATPTAEPPAVTDPPTDPPTTDPTPAETGSVPALNAQTEYEVRYPDETLRMPGDCAQTVYIDLDEPRVRVQTGLAEFTYHDPCGTQTAYVDLRQGVRGSLAPSASITPIECGELIRTSPLSDNNQPIRRGQVYCINTSLDEARNSAGTWKMVILEVTAVTQDGAATFKASAWDIPS
jgi:hypothetical protein